MGMGLLQGAHLNQGTGGSSHPQPLHCRRKPVQVGAWVGAPHSKVLSSSAVGFNPIQGHTHPAGDTLNLHSFLFSPK